MRVVGLGGYPDGKKRFFIYHRQGCLRLGMFFSRKEAMKKLRAIKKKIAESARAPL